MRRTKKLLYNTVLLTGSSLFMRCIALAFQVWLVSRIGSAGIGLFSLVMSVSTLAATFAISGIRFASTRIISEEIGLGRGGGVGGAVLRCLGYSIFFGTAACVILFFTAEPIGFLWIGDARTVLPLKILAFSMPFISMSSVFAGYFTATGRVYKNAATQISEQLVRIGLVAIFLSFAPEGDLEKSCSAVVAAGVIADLVSFIVIVLIYAADRRAHCGTGGRSERLTSRMFGIALPLAVSAYARTSLSTLEHLLVPRGLKASGMSADSALSGYGVIQGMVFPIISFPSALMLAVAELMVPELTEAQVSGKNEYISRITTSLMEKCLLFAMGAAALLFTFSGDLGVAIYNSVEAGKYIKIFALLAPIMYMDMVIDGCLKGLGQMMHSMAYNITEALIGVLLIYTLLPKYALTAYIVIICFSECYNFALSFRRLNRVTKINLRLSMIVLPLLCAVGASQAAQLIFSVSRIDPAASVPLVVLAVSLGTGIYILLLQSCGCVAFFKKKAANEPATP